MFKSDMRPCKACDETSASSDSDILGNFLQPPEGNMAYAAKDNCDRCGLLQTIEPYYWVGESISC